jgi:ribonuclease BN (tRNA processing enzyme)
LAYVTDTTARPDAPYLQAIAGADLLVHECYFPDSLAELAELTGHSVTTPVAQLARAAGVGRLVLVHVDPSAEGDDPINLAAARGIFPQTLVGHDRMEIAF